MSSSRSFRLLLVLVALVLFASAASAVTVSDANSPNDVRVGTKVDASFTVSKLYQNPNNPQWTLQTETELKNVTWTFKLVDQGGNVVSTQSADGQQANQSLSIDDGVSEVQVEVTGAVPAVSNYSYDPAPTFLVAKLTHARDGGTSSTIQTYEATHYTADSRQARQAIESAQSAIDAAGGNAQAEETLQSAISAYQGENFENAVTLAQRAQREAGQAQQTQQRNQLFIYGAIAVVVIAVVVGAAYWYLNRDTGSRL